MNRPIIKFIADFGPLVIFFVIYFTYDNDLKLAIPPFIVATLIALIVVYFLEKRIPMVPLASGVIITLFGSLTLYFDNKIFFYNCRCKKASCLYRRRSLYYRRNFARIGKGKFTPYKRTKSKSSSY